MIIIMIIIIIIILFDSRGADYWGEWMAFRF